MDFLSAKVYINNIINLDITSMCVGNKGVSVSSGVPVSVLVSRTALAYCGNETDNDRIKNDTISSIVKLN